ncbi:MAG: bifunctional pyr operon transcriptional regulator/uracil phosphoribosyltransferase [Desulfobacterales bacterium GWB2_56_26]|nr:MAG: bifunctional pyr operon transcriptional regulator/uracil phosphoribosyltransferase [Desulfobacterales bacterium GWB2_56_26]
MAAQDIDLAIQRIALQILEKNHGADRMAIVGIYTCGVYVAKRIHAFIESQTKSVVPFGALDINLYRDDWSLISQNPIVKTTEIAFDVDNTNLILVDDVIFTGRTIRAAMDAIMDYGRPETIQLAALVDRGGRELPIQPDFTGMVTGIQDKERINVVLSETGTGGEVIIES